MVTAAPVLRTSGARDLKSEIVRQIRMGRLRPGDPLRSANDLARDYGIAYVTAHKALQQLAQEGYCVRISRQGTYVSEHPTPVKIAAVGIPAYFQTAPFHARMVEELTFQAAARGIKVVIGRAENTRRFIDRMVAHGVKAMIRFPGCNWPVEKPDERAIWRLLQERGIATVVINDFWREDSPFPTVCTDEEAGVRLMMDHLIALGHRNILLMNEFVADTRFRAVEGYRASLLMHGLPYDSRNVVFLHPPRDWHAAVKLMVRQMLAQSTAAIVLYDACALALLDELRRLGMTPGKDYSIAGFEGIPEAETSGLSVVVQPAPELVATAYELLDEKNQREPHRILLKPTCVFRSSTGPAPRPGRRMRRGVTTDRQTARKGGGS